jgi:hypothetical protein
MALPSTFKIEIENDSMVWIDVTNSVVSLLDGTTSEAQIVPTIAIDFGIDEDDVRPLLDATVNPDRPRIRITENTTTTFYLMESQRGRVQENFPFPVTSGRAFCGRIVDFPLVTYVPVIDLLMSSIAQQLCVENVNDQTGDSVSVTWAATQNPTVPGKRLEFNRAERLNSLRDIAESCGAGVRASSDGLGFEVFDIPDKELSASSSFNYDCPLTITYDEQRINKPQNAIRIKGSAFDYSIGKIPVINVWVQPDSIPADGVSSSTAAAQVFNALGVPVQQSTILDQAIDADSFTSIPVSGCFSVNGVWANDGTQGTPVKGNRIEITTFDANTVTVPTQPSDLFIVTYVQAETVNWFIEDYADRVDGEAENTSGTLAVSSDFPLGTIIGVYRDTDTRRIGTNYFTGGSFTPNTTDITLGISPGPTGTAVLIDYVKFNATPLGAIISPSSSLCDADGIAKTTVGSATEVGVGFVAASSLGQQGFGKFSLTGSSVGALTLDVDPSIIRKSIEDETIINLITGEVSDITESGNDRYIEVMNPIYNVESLIVTGFGSAQLLRWENIDPSFRVYITGALPPGGTLAAVTYNGYAVVSEEDKTATLTAVLFKEDGSFVTDGTVVYFEFVGRRDLDCTLSSASATTTDGVAEIAITSGTQAGIVSVRAISGGYHAEVEVTITDEDISGGNKKIFGSSGGWTWSTSNLSEQEEAIERAERTGAETCKPVANDDNDDNGSVGGSRKLVDCEGEPLSGAVVSMDGVTSVTGPDGRFSFATGSEGTNSITVNGKSYSFEISPKDSSDRGGYKLVCTDNETGETTFEG